MSRILARLEGIERSFGSVRALDGATLEIHAGEVHGVLGANGAGKSTLLNVLGGMLTPDAGTLLVDDQPVSLPTPRSAWEHGIALVHQHFTLVPRLTVLENLALGGGRRRRLRRDVEALMERTELRVPLDAPVETLGVGDRQRVEILKALLRDPRVLVLDEPTAVLTPREVEGLFHLLRELAGEGRAVVLVAHKLDEVLGVADRVTVLRDGRTVLSGPVESQGHEELVRAMIGDARVDEMALGLRGSPPDRVGGTDSGRVDSDRIDSGLIDSGRVVARLEKANVVVEGVTRLRDVDLAARAGEVLGVAGIEGNGQRELALLLAARIEPTSGEATLPRGIGFIPQDRSIEGLVGDFDLTHNAALALHRDPTFVSGPWLRWDRLREAAEEIRVRFEVAAPSVATGAGTLSGGNQQRVVVGRELRMAEDLLVAENPTRGLDVAAAAFVHDEIRRLAGAGVAVVVVSTDLDEILGLSDRVCVLARGRLVEAPPEACTREGIGVLMLGGRDRAGREHG